MKIYFTKKISEKNLGECKTFVIFEYLTNNGKYTIKDKKLVNYKLNNLHGIDKNLGNGFIASSESWIETNHSVFTLPFKNVKIKRELSKYKINDNLFYIKEIINDKLKSDYLLTNYRLGDKRLITMLNKL